MNAWVQLAIIALSLIISYANRPKPKKQRPPAFDQFEFPRYEDSTPMGVVFGDVWVSDWMVLGVGNYRVRAVYQQVDGGK